ncbi:MAG: phosphate acyltransferase PlsX [Alphaproteobacteria bacterium]
MSTTLTLALDAMGGDNAPEAVIRGANIARKRYPTLQFVLVGDEKRLIRLVRRKRKLRERVSIRHTSEVVPSDMRPSQALRGGRASSMWHAIDAVKEGEADGVVSAGNTGALMAMAKLQLRTLPGIHRPAMASFFPTLKGESVMLDLGANVECDANNLVQFAVMGTIFSRIVLGLAEPTVGLLNVGTEEMKGHEELKSANTFLRSTNLPINFHGFIEGDDIAAGTVDVIVTDGFTGNIALKTAEGTARLVNQFLREAFKSSISAQLGYLLARRALKKLARRVDPRRHNGAMFVGLNGIAVKSHGGTDALGFANAIGVAHDMAVGGFNARIRDEFEKLNPGEIPGPASVAAGA